MIIRQFSERTRSGIKFGGGLIIALLVTLLFLLDGFTVLELLTYDWRFALRGERDPHRDILIVTIDEESEKRLQRMPWKRSVHAEMIRTLIQHHPKLIIYDVSFQAATETEEDEVLADALYDAYDEESDMGLVILAQHISHEALESPLDILADNAGGIGLINVYLDRDNIVRSIPAVTQTIEEDSIQYHLTLSLEAATLYKGGVNKIEFPDQDTIVLSRKQGNSTQEILRVVAPEGRLYINYIGGRYSYPMLSFWKILRGEFQPEEIRNKVIFIGDISPTGHDYFLTTFRAPNRKFVEALKQETLEGGELTNMSTFGIEIHAQAFQTILENSYIQKIPALWSAFLILCVGFLSGMVFFQDRKFWLNTVILLLFGGVIWGSGQYVFSAKHLWVDLAPLAVVISLNFVAGLAFQRAIALYNRNKVKGAFQQYVSTAIVEEVLRHPEKLHLGGERKFLTVLFSDIRGFTSIAESMESEELVIFLNEYLTEMTEIVLNYDGTLDKYMGDAIMAIYGAPIEQPDHPARACSSALEMVAQLRKLQPKWREQGKPPIDIGIGINSGMMTVGNMGSEKRFDYTVMGDHVNLGSRLEGINKQYGTHVIISEFTKQQVKDHFVTRELDLVQVKGRVESVKIYELIGKVGEIDTGILQGISYFGEGLTAYRQMRWQQAIEKFSQTLERFGDDYPSQLYLERCQLYQLTPPPENWDGVYIMETK